MGDHSKISWTEATWNPILGCSKVSEGCRECYAIRDAHRMACNPNPKVAAAYEGLTVIQNGRPNWTGEVRYLPDRLDQPYRWKRPRRIFVNSMSDIAHEGVKQEWFNNILLAMLENPRHTFQVLTKRPGELREMLRISRLGVPYLNHHSTLPGNIWLGASIENQKALDRLPAVKSFPAQVRWLSLEPLLEPLGEDLDMGGIDWVVVGGESGAMRGPHTARPMEEWWVEQIIRQCRKQEVPVYVKQMGTVWADRHGATSKAGAYPNEWPEWLRVRVREYPA